MAIDLFRLGLTFILFGVLFPFIEFINEYISAQTALVTFIFWMIGIMLILASAFIKQRTNEM